MSVLMVPALDGKAWPTLGPRLCEWIEKNLVFGPGDMRGVRAVIDDEKRALIYRLYEVFPRTHERAGRRRFRRACISLRKGSAKTELAAWLAAAELHPSAPVRCDGFDERGNPRTRPVKDPYIPLVAYTEEQSDDLAYGALKAILEESPVAKDFDIGLERILRKHGDGKAASLASAPGARDGARTTFQIFDETHHFTLLNLKRAHRTMLANLYKRKASDPWSLETTTAFVPGELSVAEETMVYAKAVEEGRKSDARLFYFHRWADESIEVYDDTGAVVPTELERAIVEASGGLVGWTDVDGVAEQWADPTADRVELEKLWLNRIKHGQKQAFDPLLWAKQILPEHVVPDGALITIGFDGSRTQDGTAAIATEILTGFQWPLGIWERPFEDRAAHERIQWEVPEGEVDAAIRGAFERFRVWRMYGDPPNWETHMAKWSGEYGEESVVRFRTNHWRKMCGALKNYRTSMTTGDLRHGRNDADQGTYSAYCRHVGNARKLMLRSKDEDGEFEWVIVKDRKESPNKIDAAVAGALSWQARTDALASGVKLSPSVYETRGMVQV